MLVAIILLLVFLSPTTRLMAAIVGGAGFGAFIDELGKFVTSDIGFGAQPPTPEWGVMISDGRNFISTQPWLSLFPGLAILLAVGAFNLLGDGLRDLFDPRLRRIA
jgi:peptide/nickel transport system permease protein